MSKDNGGSAFPQYRYTTSIAPDITGGMTLRDYFAAVALPIWIQAHIDQSVDDLSKPEIARECYSYADAMLAERAKC